jgi:hypothetical protein
MNVVSPEHMRADGKWKEKKVQRCTMFGCVRNRSSKPLATTGAAYGIIMKKDSMNEAYLRDMEQCIGQRDSILYLNELSYL